MLRITVMLFAALCLFAGAAFAQQKSPGLLLQKTLHDLPDREGMMLIVEYPPGASSAKHRHNAHTFVYVLEGSVIMQVEGGERVTLKPGETFYETPDDIHVVSMNASETEPAKILVFFVKRQGAPLSMPVP